MSISDYLEAKILNAVFNATAYSEPGDVWVSLHDADPTDVTATALANEITGGSYVRKQVAFDTAAGVGGIVDNDADIVWTGMPECVAGGANEQLGWVAIFDAATVGNLLWSGALTTPKNINAGDTFTVAAGDLDVTLA